MPGPYCFTPINACRLRVALLDDSGAPDPGADSMVVTSDMIELGYETVVTPGASFEQPNGCGDICLSYEGKDRIKAVTLTIQLCKLDFELIELMTGADPDVIDGVLRGLALPAIDVDLDRRVSIEAWSEAYDVDQPLTEGADVGYLRTIFPSTSWVEGPRSYKQGNTIIQLNGKGRSNANFGNGPGNDLTWGKYTSPKGEFLDFDDLPEATCGYQTLVAS
jgi:hypothetical protein